MATESDSVNTGLLATIVAVGTLLTLAIALAVTALVRSTVDDAAAAKGSTVNARPYRQVRADQEAKLNSPPAWADKSAGAVSIPIESAMNLVVNELRTHPELATPVTQASPEAPSAEPLAQERAPVDLASSSPAEQASPTAAKEAPAAP